MIEKGPRFITLGYVNLKSSSVSSKISLCTWIAETIGNSSQEAGVWSIDVGFEYEGLPKVSQF